MFLNSPVYLAMWLGAHTIFKRVFRPHIVAWRPDIVHCHDGLSLPLCASLAQTKDVVTIFDSHELEAHRNQHLISYMRPRIKRIERTCLPQMDTVITVSKSIAAHLAKAYNIPMPMVLYNAPVSSSENASVNWPDRWKSTNRASVRGESIAPKDSLLVVYTGNIAPGRGLEDVLHGIKHFITNTQSLPNIHLSMVGTCRMNARSNLTELARDLGIESNIEFHDAVSPAKVSSYISDADVAVIPIPPNGLSHEFAMPNKLFEAAHAGLPIIATQLQEMSQYIAQYDLGECYPAGRPEVFSKRLENLVSNLPARKLQARKHAGQHTWTPEASKLLSVYKKISSGQRKTRVAMVVPNPCDPDYRVVKQAESLAQAGYTVRVFCTDLTGGQNIECETINLVEYQRIGWSVNSILRAIFLNSALVPSLGENHS